MCASGIAASYSADVRKHSLHIPTDILSKREKYKSQEANEKAASLLVDRRKKNRERIVEGGGSADRGMES